MSTIGIGDILLLDPRLVSENAINVLTTRLRTPPTGFLVRCCKCGTERHHPTLIDPGQLAHDRFTCQTVNEMCRAGGAKPPLVGYSLVPGSLVLALHDPCRGRFWPAIVEDSPDNFSRHAVTVHSGYHTPAVTAYFVTFINLRYWMGGWMRADSLFPYSSRVRSGVSSRAERINFAETAAICDECLGVSLSERLLLLSFVVFAARQRGFLLSDTRMLAERIQSRLLNCRAAELAAGDEMDWEESLEFYHR